MPARPSEFEEKEYEAPLYNQLERTSTGQVWSPGQVFERLVGIDRALFLSDPALWRILGFRQRRGIILEDIDWHFWKHRPRRSLPTFRLNLFIQAKRCFFHSERPRRFKRTALASPCWHFDIEVHQQQALEQVAAKINRRAVVCYAAPAFHRCTELYGHTAAGTVNQNSTFPTVAKLKGHGAWYYDRPGGRGVANPDPEEIQGPDIFGLMGGLQQNGEGDYSLVGLSREIDESLSEVPADNPRRAIFFDRRNYVRAQLNQSDGLTDTANGEVSAFFDIAVFSETFNLDWYVIK
jgi:hypothetical protein